MTAPAAPSIHASAVVVGDRAVLIRGPSGSGKSRLAFDLILAGQAGQIAAARLVGDDRLHLRVSRDSLVVSPVPELAGLIEIRGLGIRRCDHVAQAGVGLVVDLASADAERLPDPAVLQIMVDGVSLPRIPVGTGFSPLPLVLAALTTFPAFRPLPAMPDCPKGFGNHISPTLATE